MITREKFIEATGHEPENDDLERVNCPRVGEIGHQMCGWNDQLDRPVFAVGPVQMRSEAELDQTRQQLRQGNAKARDAIRGRGIGLHPKIAAKRAERD